MVLNVARKMQESVEIPYLIYDCIFTISFLMIPKLLFGHLVIPVAEQK